jgi:hypothetical protein
MVRGGSDPDVPAHDVRVLPLMPDWSAKIGCRLIRA